MNNIWEQNSNKGHNYVRNSNTHSFFYDHLHKSTNHQFTTWFSFKFLSFIRFHIIFYPLLSDSTRQPSLVAFSFFILIIIHYNFRQALHRINLQCSIGHMTKIWGQLRQMFSKWKSSILYFGLPAQEKRKLCPLLIYLMYSTMCISQTSSSFMHYLDLTFLQGVHLLHLEVR